LLKETAIKRSLGAFILAEPEAQLNRTGLPLAAIAERGSPRTGASTACTRPGAGARAARGRIRAIRPDDFIGMAGPAPTRATSQAPERTPRKSGWVGYPTTFTDPARLRLQVVFSHGP